MSHDGKDLSSVVHRAVLHYQLTSSSKLLRRLNVKNERRIVSNLTKRKQEKQLIDLLHKRDYYNNKINELLNHAAEETDPKLIDDEDEAEFYLARRFLKDKEKLHQTKTIILNHNAFQEESSREYEKIVNEFQLKQPAANGLSKLRAMNNASEKSWLVAKEKALKEFYERIYEKQKRLASESESMLRQLGVPFFCFDNDLQIEEEQLKQSKERILATLYKLVKI